MDLPDRPAAALHSSMPEGVVKRIATHSKPDGDAIAAAWLAETSLFPREDVVVLFVPACVPDSPVRPPTASSKSLASARSGAKGMMADAVLSALPVSACRRSPGMTKVA